MLSVSSLLPPLILHWRLELWPMAPPFNATSFAASNTVSEVISLILDEEKRLGDTARRLSTRSLFSMPSSSGVSQEPMASPQRTPTPESSRSRDHRKTISEGEREKDSSLELYCVLLLLCVLHGISVCKHIHFHSYPVARQPIAGAAERDAACACPSEVTRDVNKLCFFIRFQRTGTSWGVSEYVSTCE